MGCCWWRWVVISSLCSGGWRRCSFRPLHCPPGRQTEGGQSCPAPPQEVFDSAPPHGPDGRPRRTGLALRRDEVDGGLACPAVAHHIDRSFAAVVHQKHG